MKTLMIVDVDAMRALVKKCAPSESEWSMMLVESENSAAEVVTHSMKGVKEKKIAAAEKLDGSAVLGFAESFEVCGTSAVASHCQLE